MTDYPPAGGLCPNCGSQLIPGAKFCAVCGQAVAEAQTQDTLPVWAAPAPAPIASDTVWTPADVPPAPPAFSATKTLPAPQALPAAQTAYAPPPPPAYWQPPAPYAPPAYGQPPALIRPSGLRSAGLIRPSGLRTGAHAVLPLGTARRPRRLAGATCRLPSGCSLSGLR
jgi:hypothetical protein